MPKCHQCGQEFEIDDHGIATHRNSAGEIDYDMDAHHVAYTLENTDNTYLSTED